MLWLHIINFLCGLYEVLMGCIGIFLYNNGKAPFDGLQCLDHGFTWNSNFKGLNGCLAEMFITLHIVVAIMTSTLHYIVFFSIPYYYDRLKKEPKEIKLEKRREIKRVKAKQKIRAK
jgi:hypothetical protein